MNTKIYLVLFGLTATLATQAQSYVPEQNDARMKVKTAVPVQAYAFNLSEVKLLDGPFRKAMEADAAYLLKIEPDRLLSDFRVHSGLKPKAEKYGGWESSGLAGHTLGHYLSACAMQYAATKNKAFLDRVTYIVKELDTCQVARKTGYIGAIPKEDTVWAEVAKGDIKSRGFDLNGAWSPWYTVHKVMAGLLDAYLYCGNTEALAVETKMADWADVTFKDMTDEQWQKMLLCEYGGMNDVLVNTYALTGKKKYLDLSYKFHDRRILDSLAEGKDILPGKHSNTQIPKVIGSARRFELTGDKKDEATAKFFWQTVVKHHSYATGGNSNYEYLSEPDKLSGKLTENTTETCNTYNMLKLTRHLFALQPSAGLMNFYEKALYNHILASQNHSDGMMCYFVPLRMGGQKEFSSPFTTFTCCVGSGIENHVKYGESIYFKGADGSLFVNLFIPSELSWKEKGLVLKQETRLPETDNANFTLTLKKAQTFPLRIRKPEWAGAVALKVNGQHQKPVLGDDGYLVIDRTWKNGDRIELISPPKFYTEAMPDNANRRAVFYGPVLLAGILGDKEPDPVKGTPVFVTSTNDTQKWLKTIDRGTLKYATAGLAVPKQVELMPFNQVSKQFYSVYWDVFTPEEWAKQQKVYEAEKIKERDREVRTVDALRIGEMQPERDHNFTGENTETGEEHGKKWRIARENGYLSFTMKVSPDKKNTLYCTYWGMDNRGRKFDILVDGKPLASEDLNQYKESRFYEIAYELPVELTKGKSAVTIKLQPQKDNNAGPLYGCRIIRE
ncbi:MAG: glycoside hydrolase family 127 protein [Mucilaginibacter polytrichastri]|nr:glycoside hydrolase family 127 protein [Mucilaginibacter polytrichastri]